MRRLFVNRGLRWVLFATLAGTCVPALADVDLPTKFSNLDSIVNTRHNLTQTPIGSGAQLMNPYRNDYGAVCVYCHTPHGANQTLKAPLWNRTMPTTPYTTYAALGTSTITQPITSPGTNSLTCLSCHDGTIAVDSIINMPNVNGDGGVSPNYNTATNRDTVQNNTFLNGWTNPSGPDAGSHLGMNDVGCLGCHAAGAPLGSGATDFRVFAIGTDLRDDHPVGVRFPDPGPGVDFAQPGVTTAELKIFDSNSNGRADSNEVRMYETGDGYEVECASCHDPHGAPTGAPGSAGPRIPSFLRVDNSNGSALCMTCHTK